MAVRTTTLANGLRIVTEEMPHLETVTVGLWADVGSRHETETFGPSCRFKQRNGRILVALPKSALPHPSRARSAPGGRRQRDAPAVRDRAAQDVARGAHARGSQHLRSRGGPVSGGRQGESPRRPT